MNNSAPSQQGFIVPIVVFLGIVIVLSGIIVGSSFYIKTTHPQWLENMFPVPQASIPAFVQPTAKPTPVLAKQVDPLAVVVTAFNKRNFIITAQGVASLTTSSASGSSYTTLGSASPISYYTKQGDLVRVDDTSTTSKYVYIFSNDQIYRLNPDTKSYTMYSKSDQKGGGPTLYWFVQQAFIVQKILLDNAQHPLTWKEVASDTWQTNWTVLSLASKDGMPVQFKLHINPQTSLIDKTSFRLSDTEQWQDINWSYRAILNMDNFLTISSDYKTASSSADLSPTPSGSGTPLTCSGLIFTQNNSPVTSVKAGSGVKITANISGNIGALDYMKAAFPIQVTDDYKNLDQYKISYAADSGILDLPSVISKPSVNVTVQLTEISDSQGSHLFSNCTGTLVVNK